MNKRIFDFLSSFGIMALGVFLIIICTVSFSSARDSEDIFSFFPAAGPRQEVNLIQDGNAFPESAPLAPHKREGAVLDFTLSAFSAIAIDSRTGEILFAKDPDKIRPLASVTKLMTALVLLDLPIKWDEEIEVIADDCDASSHQVEAGEIFTRHDLWQAALIGSANGAVRALVRTSGVTEADFVARMNAKARELGLTSLTFVEPTGLSSGNVGHVRDVAALLDYALKSEKIKDTVNQTSQVLRPAGTGRERVVWSTNRLLTGWVENNFDKKNIFGKTGYISDARYNFVVSLGRQNPVIVAVFGAESDETRFLEAKTIGEWVMANWFWE